MEETEASGTGLKRPKTAYFMFLDDERSKPEYSGLKIGEVGKRVAAAWKELSPDDKAVSALIAEVSVFVQNESVRSRHDSSTLTCVVCRCTSSGMRTPSRLSSTQAAA